MPKIHLIEGPVGAGKSTYSTALAQRVSGVHIALDEWFVHLFSPDRPDVDVVSWYIKRKARLQDLIWLHTQSLLASGATPILELGLVQQENREAFYRKIRNANIELQVTVVEASREVRRERVAQRNVEQGPTFSMIVPEPIFDMASNLWESPGAEEITENQIEIISTEN